tara:strand:- start:1125 stop:2483 length:1359 start_codon:yes stop_codon:yes gene_type:complete
MANQQKNAGFFVLKSFKVKPLLEENLNRDSENSSMPEFVEMSKTIIDFGISESLDSPFISGYAVVHESDNLLESVPLLGEEEITMTVEDFYGESRSYKLFLYAIEQVGPASSINDRMMKYTIRFTSIQKLQGDQTSIRKSYNNTKISEIVEDIYNTFMLTGNKEYDKPIEIEETDGEQSLVIPDMRTDAAMQFLSRRAYSQKNNTSLYRFFETREKYFFCTPEYLIEKYGDFKGKNEEEINRLKFIYNTVEDNTGPGQRIAQQSVNDVSYGNKVDTFLDMKEGMYRRTVTELDPTTRTRIQRDYDYTTEYQEKEMPEKLKLTHTQTFLDKYMAASTQPEEYLIVDFPQIGQSTGKQDMKKPYQHFYENYTAKPVVNYHFFRNTLSMEINGRLELHPGMLIDLELYKFRTTVAGTREFDHERSGKYIVTSVDHVFSGDSYKQAITMTKGGLKA